MYATRKRWYESLDVFLIRHRSLSLLQKKKYKIYIYSNKNTFFAEFAEKIIDDFVRYKNRRERVMRRDKERGRKMKRAKEREECSPIKKASVVADIKIKSS